MLAAELEHPLLMPHVPHSRPRRLTSDESVLLAAALAFLESLWRATRSAHPMQVWRVRVIIRGRPFFLLYAMGIELWSWPARARQRFREDEASSLDSISTK
jgi:hypothetical protein